MFLFLLLRKTTVSSTTITMLHVRSSDLFHLVTGSLFLGIFSSLHSSWQLLFYSLFLWVQLVFLRFHICEIIQCLFFSIWLISLRITPSRFIHVIANGKFFFFILAEWYCTVYTHTHTYHMFFIHSFVGRHLGYFNILAIVSNASVNMGHFSSRYQFCFL